MGRHLGDYPYTIHVEVSSPTATATPTRPPDFNGWYNHAVGVIFQGTAFSGIASCTPPPTYAAPDSANATISGTCTDNAGKTAGASISLKYDATPPTITAAIPSRRPDHDGWYNHPVSFSFSGTDATSGISSCTDTPYSGPDSAGASLTGSCTDRAGNVATRPVTLRYDASPPSPGLSAAPGDGIVGLHWRMADVAPISSLEVTRSPGVRGARTSVVYRGHSGSFSDKDVRNGVRYRYTLTVRDQAGNVTTRKLQVTPGPRLLSPPSGAQISAPPLLRWTPVRRASYYNVQLYHGGKVLSEWPERCEPAAHREMVVRRTASPASAGPLSLVCVAGLRTPIRCPLRAGDRLGDVRGPLHLTLSMRPA